jgi:hypothetical protein
MSMNADEIEDFLKVECIPKGYKYTLVLASVVKRALRGEMPENYRLQFLGHLEKMTQGENANWLNSDMIAAIDPMDDKGEEIATQIRKVGPQKALDVYADTFALLASLNPSLIAALKLSPKYLARRETSAGVPA